MSSSVSTATGAAAQAHGGGGGGGSSASSVGPPPQYFSLRWNNHQANLVSVFSGLYTSETLVDVTLAAEGKHIQAHKMLLSACSDYFQSLFSVVNPCQHPIVILKDVHFDDLQTVVQFMYHGVVNVSSEKLPAVLKTADTLQIKGLGEKFSESVNEMMSGGSAALPRSPRLLSVPSQHSVNSRQMSTESLPEYLHRNRELSSRQASTDSRQYSVESAVSAHIRKHPTPPASPPRHHFRKKFRRMSGGGSGSSERGNSLEDDRSPLPAGGLTACGSRTATPPTIHLSPSRQSSSSTDHDTTTLPSTGTATPGGLTPNPASSGPTVAKKKRELFSARSSRSGGSNKSSCSDHSREHSFRLESSGSSGHSHSINQSQDDGLPLPSAPAAHQQPPVSTSSLTVPSSGRTLARAQSAGEATSPALPTKRSRYLKRQDCLEKGMDLTTDGSDADLSTVGPPVIKSSPNSPLMGGSAFPPGSPMHGSDSSLSLKPESSPLPLSPAPGSPSPSSSHHAQPHLTKQKSQPVLPSEHAERTSIYAGRHPMYAYSSEQPHPGPAHMSHKLPSVRVIPDAAVDPLSLEYSSLPVPNVRLLCPPVEGRRHHLVKSRSTDSSLERIRSSVSVTSAPLLAPPPTTTTWSSPASTSPSVVSASSINNSSASAPPPPPSSSPQPVSAPTPSTSVPPPTTSPSFESPAHLHPLGSPHAPLPAQSPSPTAPPSAGPSSMAPNTQAAAGMHVPSSMSASQTPDLTLSSAVPGLIHPSVSPPGPVLGPGGPLHLQQSASIHALSSSLHHHAPHLGQPPHSQSLPPPPASSSATSSPSSLGALASSSSLSVPVDGQFGHCPKAREGPALGCNYCWNTTDASGRILRRKTKYHCPECQANLCIVPCFQQYHEALEREKEASPH